ncbi:unnamed protein product [Camellia sinensis]
MYPSNSNGNNNNSISYSLFDINPNSKQEDHPSSLFHLPSPYIHYEDDVVLLQNLHDLLLQQQQLPPTTNVDVDDNNTAAKVEAMTTTNMAESSKQCHSVLPRKRTSKKDRHSKINTAQGPRDRRMRLSLEVARDFFNLQDMLGFDKASKTVEWLLTKSKAAIKELTRSLPHHMKHSCSVGGGANSASSTSECEVVSGMDESAGIDGNQPVRTGKAKPSSASLAAKEKKAKALRKSAFNPLAKESREKARARARERTRDKRRFGESEQPLEAMNHDMNRLGSWSPFENGEESGINPHLDVLADVHEELSSSMIFNYDPHSSGINSQEQQQFTGFQVYGKPWEAYMYNNINLC